MTAVLDQSQSSRVRRRIRLVDNALARVIGLIPDRLAPCVPEIGAVRKRLEGVLPGRSENALTELRGLAAAQLRMLPAPLGFHPHRLGATDRNRTFQHEMGPDPPPRGA